MLEISPHLDDAVLIDGEGGVTASSIAGGAGSERLARAGLGLLEGAGERFATGGRALTQLEAALREGSIFVVRADARTIVARARPKAPSLLVFHDLRACLQAAAPARRRPKRHAAGKKVEQAADA